jgi:hypothetical protein
MKYKLLLIVRTRVDRLEKLLAPGVVLPKARVDRWKKILKLQNKNAITFVQRMKNKGINPDLFPEIVSLLCRDTNGRAAHFNLAMPKNPTEKAVREALQIVDIQDDHETVQSFILLAESLPNPEPTTTKDNLVPTEDNKKSST